MKYLKNVVTLEYNPELCTGCGMCLESHEKTLRKHEVPVLTIQSAARIAAVIHAVAVASEQADAAAKGAADAVASEQVDVAA